MSPARFSDHKLELESMTNTWVLSALWVDLALVATLFAIWFRVSTALSEIVVGTVAQLIIGALLGSGGLLGNTAWITFLAGTGAIVLTFLAGAELDPTIFRSKWREALIIGLAGFIGPFLGCTLIAHFLLHWSVMASWLCGVALSTTSVAVVYAVMLDGVGELNGVVHELRSLVTGMERYLKHELATDLEKRLLCLEMTGFDVDLLRLLEQIVTRSGLVEFRPRIDALAVRLEDDSFELALFGRVSCGKSSLLNALLNTDVLPVGINPITAVPTKLRYGPELRAAVAFGDGQSAIVSVDELAKLVTEQGNPGNLRNVVRAIVEVPPPRLREGIMLVDTPGLGSLAKRGAAETPAYLPSCDLALLLIDAGATLNEEDIGTLRLLY
jgi:Dynamin family/Sodium/hydrogen exchanger family